MSDLRTAVDAIWATLGMAPPVGAISDTYAFELEGMPIALQLTPAGDSGLIHADIGCLSGQQLDASAQMARLLRFGLGLVASNRAVLELPQLSEFLANPYAAPVPVRLTAQFTLDPATDAVEALRDIVEWQGYAETVIGPPGAEDPAPIAAPITSDAGHAQTEDDENLVIFRP